MITRLLFLLTVAALTFPLSPRAAAADSPNAEPPAPVPAPRTLTDGEMRGILAALEDPSPEVRIQALRFCPNAIFGPPQVSWPPDSPLRREISQSIGRSLPGDWPENQSIAASVLGFLGPAAAEQVPAVIALLRHPDREVRESATGALGRLGPVAAPRVAALFKDPDNEVKFQATVAMGGMGAAAAGQVPALIALLKDPNSYVDNAAADALTRLGVVALPHAADICALFRHSNADARAAAAKAFGGLGAAAGAHALELAALLKDRDQDVKLAAVLALGKLGAAAAPHAAEISALLKHRDGYVRGHAADTLGLLGAAAVPFASDISVLLVDPDGSVPKGLAARALGRLGPAAAAPYLSDIASLVSDPTPYVRLSAVQALDRLGAATPAHVAVIMEMLNHSGPDGGGRSAAVEILGKLSAAATAPEVPNLIALLHHWDSDVSSSAARALGLLSPSVTTPHVTEIIALLSDTEYQPRMAAGLALGALGETAAPRATEVAALLRHPERHVRSTAIHALGEMKAAAVPNAAALGTLLKGPDLGKATEAAFTLGRLGPAAAAPYAADLADLLKKPGTFDSPAIALIGLGGVAAPHAAPQLIAMCMDSNENVRDTVMGMLVFCPEAIDAARAPGPGPHPPSDPRMLLEAAWTTIRHAPKMAWLAYYLAGDDEDHRWLIRHLLPRLEVTNFSGPLPAVGEEWKAAVTRLTRAVRLWKTDAPRTVAAMAGLAAALISGPPRGETERALVDDLRKALAEAGHAL